MAKYDEVLIMNKKEDYTLEQKAKVFDQIWSLAKNYYDNYSNWGGDNDDEECDFRNELKNIATNIVFPYADEDSIIELIDDLKEEEEEDEEE